MPFLICLWHEFNEYKVSTKTRYDEFYTGCSLLDTETPPIIAVQRENALKNDSLTTKEVIEGRMLSTSGDEVRFLILLCHHRGENVYLETSIAVEFCDRSHISFKQHT